MITRLAGHDYLACCISAHRPYAVNRWLRQGLGNLTWFVPREEFESYRDAPAKRPGSSASNAIARNQALRLGARLNMPTLLLDDDPIAAYEVIAQKAVKIRWIELLTRLAELHREHGCMMTSANRNTNPYFVRKDLNFYPKLTTGCLIINPGSPEFDENLKMAVDLDYGMQHLAHYGAFLRVDSLIAEMEMGLKGQESVVQDQRTSEEYRRTNRYLKEKWGSALIASKNEGQLTLRRRRRREILT